MRKQILFLTLAALLAGFYSCSDDNEPYDPTKGLVEIDYKADLGYFKDMTITTDGTVYSIAYDQHTGINFYIKKVTTDGTVSIVKELDEAYFGNTMRITNTHDDEIFFTTDMPPYYNKIMAVSSDFSTIGTIQIRGTDGPFAPVPRLTGVAPYENNSLVVFDSSYKQLKRYYFTLGVDIVVAGSEKDEIKDGVGLEAGFSYVNRIIPYGDAYYVLDKSKNIRIVEKQGDGMPKVTTIFADSPVEIQDMAIDSDGNFYLATIQGLYTLKQGTKSIELISDKYNIDVKTKDGTQSNIHMRAIDNIYIKGKDLYYVEGHGTLVKINDFKTKFDQLKEKGQL